ncbi:MAG: hypothetical protein J0M10_03960 [Chitinophagales bacterium]|nr:hypothetical protein [Chitinophagales bacterium]
MTIIPFNPDTFAQALQGTETTLEVIKSKKHYTYFLRYFSEEEGIHAQYMVIEDGYVSRDYLHDFAAYYAFCFKPYLKDCRRIHFFKTTITEELLNRAILDEKQIDDQWWKENYLGFIVVKPIPTTVIGFTVLIHYNTSNPINGRMYWGLRDYKVHVFGREVTINSLAFQEQDSVLAACATTAIWTMLNKAANNPQTILKTPSEITRDAGSLSSDGGRIFPNRGLSVMQICQAILSSGLETEVKGYNAEIYDEKGKVKERIVSNNYTKKVLHAYAPLGIPIILVVKVPYSGGYDLHAITVSGYKRDTIQAKDLSDKTSWVAENINRFYAHDDQYGPFAKVDFVGEGLSTQWSKDHKDNLPTWVTKIIVPVFPKVRISYPDIEAMVVGIDKILSVYFDKKIRHDLVWDIQILFSETYKEQIKKSELSEAEKLRLLTESMPKYLWVVTCYISVYKVVQFTFDATDVNNGMIGRELLCFMPADDISRLHTFLVQNTGFLKKISSQDVSPHYFEFLVQGFGRYLPQPEEKKEETVAHVAGN